MLWRRMASLFQEETMRMQVRADQAAHKSVCDITANNQVVQEAVL